MAKIPNIRDSRLWQNSLAHATVFDGVPGECMKWLQFAKLKLQFMLHNTPGPLSATYVPADGVMIRVDSRPNRIWIKTGRGDVYITIQNLTIPPLTHTVLPPYQAVDHRFLYETATNITDYPLGLGAEIFYAGGTLFSDNGDGSTTEQIIVQGGSWRSQTTAMSWTSRFEFDSGSYYLRTTIFIGGRYGELSAFGTTPPLPVYGSIVAATVVVPTAAIIALYPGAANYPKTAIFLIYTGSGLAVRMYGVKTAFAVSLSTLFLGQQTVTMPVTGYTPSLVMSGFARDSKRLAVIAPINVLTLRQKAYIMTFSDDYTTITATEVYDGLLQRRQVTTTTSTTVDGLGRGTSTFSYSATDIPGEPVIHAVQADEDNFCVLRSFVSDPVNTRSANWDNTYNGNWHGTASETVSHKVHVEVAALSGSGISNPTSQIAAIPGYSVSTSSNIGAPNPGDFISYDTTNMAVTIRAGYFSAVKRNLLLRISEIETLATGTGTGRDIDESQTARFLAASITSVRKADIEDNFYSPVLQTITIPNRSDPFPASSTATFVELYNEAVVFASRNGSQNNDKMVLWNLTLGESSADPGICIATDLPITENGTGPSLVSYVSGRNDEYTDAGTKYYSPVALTQKTFNV